MEETMTDYANIGFLHSSIDDGAGAILEEAGQVVAFYLKANWHGHRLLDDIHPHTRDPREWLTACLFVRLLEGGQAMYRLARIGMRWDSAILLRSCLETYFFLLNFQKFPDFSKKYAAKGMKGSRAMANQLFTPEVRDRLSAEEIEQLDRIVEETGQYIDDFGKAPSIEKLATDADVSVLYNGPYRMLSPYTHSEIGPFFDYLDTVEGEIAGVSYGPQSKSIRYHLWLLSWLLLGGAEACMDVFELAERADLEALIEEHDGLQHLVDVEIAAESRALEATGVEKPLP